MSEMELVHVDGINTYNEKSLHAALKHWYAGPQDQLEVRVDGFIIDLVRQQQLIEIQTGSFHPLKRKLSALVQQHPVRLVYPVALEKWIIMEGQPPVRRKSPKRGAAEQVFAELVYIPALIAHENFSLEVLLIREEEVRRAIPKKHARSKGWVCVERRLLEVVSRRVFTCPQDLIDMLPAGLPDPFTTRQLATAMRQRRALAYKIIYALNRMGALQPAGKHGRSNLYTRGALPA